MRASTDTLTRPRKAPVPLCVPCRGSGQDPQAPSRVTDGRGNVLFLVRPCLACEGHGVQPRDGDRDLARFDYLTP